MFKPIEPKPKFPELEEEILKFWEENQIFAKSLEQTKNGERFVFFEGPPTANGKPGIHHVEARAFKDLFPRFQTMLGKFVSRKGGWDTHGLPVELEVEKKLGISGKKQIESIKPNVRDSIIEFNRLCRESVWQYKEDWEKLTKRMGFWVDLDNPYITYSNSYIESVWSIVKEINDKKLIYLGHKVVPYCPRCGTALSSHEVAQGYQTVSDQSVYVKFKLRSEPNTYILSWTTTPWTLPGNVALAVGGDIDYFKVEKDGEFYIVAKDRVNSTFSDITKIDDRTKQQYKGKDLVGLEYEPLFDIPELKSDKSYKVYAADFVNTEDGTGVVHTAVMYGEDDYQLGEELGLPKHHTVDETGRFTPEVAGLAGMYVKDHKTDQKIFELLGDRVLKIEKYKHEYPHCWRCGTPLLYYARDSWFIAMSKLRDQLKANNEQINWTPDYIKHGRFGEWLDGVKDWAISRERYLGTPLPIWTCDQEHLTVPGSIKDLGLAKNNFYFLRHGEAYTNVKRVCSSKPGSEMDQLTEKGQKLVQATADELAKLDKFDLIVCSEFNRTMQTAEIVNKKLKVELIIDPRLNELNCGEYDGRTYDEFDRDFPHAIRWSDAPKGGETWTQARDRMLSLINDLNEKHQGKNILIVSHGDPLYSLQKHFGSDRSYPHKGQAFEMNVAIIDIHRPYIDEVVLKCKECNKDAKRVPAVMDVWFDSGSMPFAQWHYPMENKEKIENKEQFPADFISEAIDQTRGWFYTLLAVSTLLDKGPSYKNVISLGFLLDSKGQKMSKSKGNVIDPWSVINKYGVDSLRWYMYSVNQPGDDKRFGERDAELVLRKNFVILWNVLSFFVTYANHDQWDASKEVKELDILDQWMLTRTQKLVNQVTEYLQAYDAFHASREIEVFINELSTWYVRRSRDRKGPAFYQTLNKVLKTLSILLAPFVPFVAESLWQELKAEGEKESVHLASWPETKDQISQPSVLYFMEQVRTLVVEGLSARKAANIKLRQPLGVLKYSTVGKNQLTPELEQILLDELNFKQAEFDNVKDAYTVKFDSTISPELKKEGLAAELERLVQDMRKKSGLKVGEVINLTYDTNDGELSVAFELFDRKKTYVKEIQKGQGGQEVEIEGKKISIKLE